MIVAYPINYTHLLIIVGSSEKATLLHKNPLLNDAFECLQDKSNSWDDIGRKLNVDLNKRKALRSNPALEDDHRLEEVLYLWLEKGGNSSNWEQLIKALKEIKFNDSVFKIQQFLDKDDVIEKYCKSQ